MGTVHELYPIVDDHPVKRRLFDTLRREFYWSHMNNDAYTTVANVSDAQRKGIENVIRMN